MLIKVENRGISNDGYADMSVIIKKSKDNIPIEVYYIAVLNAFCKALDAFFTHELEQDDDEE